MSKQLVEFAIDAKYLNYQRAEIKKSNHRSAQVCNKIGPPMPSALMAHNGEPRHQP